MDRFTENSVTYVTVSPPPEKVSREGTHFFLGSCFAENLYKYFQDLFVDCFFSPFGNVYNPLSLARSIDILCSGEPVREKDVFLHRDLWRHFDFDTELCLPSREKYLDQLNRSLDSGRQAFHECTHLYLTLGTAFVYRLSGSREVVNNCHKLPSSRFTRECASVGEMKKSLLTALDRFRATNKKAKIVITLSPVRHLRDNPAENSLSKARLRCLIDELSRERAMWYFPAYEIMLDQLRDYRWYGPDMAHPSPAAVEYLMERFVESAADDGFKKYLEEMSALRKRLDHRILHRGTEEAEKFIGSTKKLIEDLSDKYPGTTGLKEAAEAYVHES